MIPGVTILAPSIIRPTNSALDFSTPKLIAPAGDLDLVFKKKYLKL